jgi:hypothetical protein
MLRILLPVVGISAVVATGAVHGLWTDRWGLAEEPATAPARLEQIPLSLPDWEGQTIDSGKINLDGATGCLHRHYVHHRTGKEVTVFLVCGRPGPVSIHTPDVCYAGSGYEVLSQTKYAPTLGPTAPGAEFHTGQFRQRRAADQTYLRIFWAWSATGDWSAPNDPRFAFARYPALFKLYLIRELTVPDEPLEDDPSVELMRQLLPEMRRALFERS